jgi:F-type H+-transporting ATPase subunit b
MTGLRWFLALAVCGVALGAAPAARAADEAQGDGHAPAAAASPDPLTVDPDLMIWTFVVFVVLMIVLSKFAWGPISEALEAREHAIEENIAAAQRANDEAKALLADYERRLAQAHEEVRGILEEARRDAEHTKQSILAEARAEAQTERDRALRDIDLATDRAVKELAEQSANMAVGLAGRILRSQLGPQDQAQLVRDALTEFAASKPSAN